MAVTESTHTSLVMAEAKRQMRGAVVIKHADKATSGIPDIQLCWLGAGAFIEMKYQRRGQKLKQIIKVNQLTMCSQLATTMNGRCWVAVFKEDPCRTIDIWRPQDLFCFLYPNLSVPALVKMAKPLLHIEGWDVPILVSMIRADIIKEHH